MCARAKERERVRVECSAQLICLLTWFVCMCVLSVLSVVLFFSISLNLNRSSVLNFDYYYLLWSERQGDGARLDGLLPPNRFCVDVEHTCNVSIFLLSIQFNIVASILEFHTPIWPEWARARFDSWLPNLQSWYLKPEKTRKKNKQKSQLNTIVMKI